MNFRGWTNSFNYLPPEAAPPLSEATTFTSQLSFDSSGLTWPEATPEQLAFLKRVYDISLQRKAGRTFVNDVPDGELDLVEGRFKLRNKAAQAAKEMLHAARRAIQSSGIDVEVGLTSAYRSAAHQFRLWNDYVSHQYYQRTKAHRQGLEGGEHGEAAAQYLATYAGGRIATPGYSNHNNGLAIDIKNTQDGKLYRNKTKKAFTDAWRTTWLWDWLTSHAATYNFYQNTRINEPWHWVYKETLSSGQTIDWSKITDIPNIVWSTITNWFDHLKLQWIKEQIAKKTFIENEPDHNLCLLPFPIWIDKSHFQNEFKRKHGTNANIILGNPTMAVTANYFVIHDTAASNEANSTSKPANSTGIHMWLNTNGAYQTHDWNYRGDGTKLEKGKNGCFVHTELVRHRKLDQAVPGIKEANTYYTDLQYELLAYAYVVCSMRKGRLLEVTVHREVDRSIKNGHNDPQHFNMNRFYQLIDQILNMPTTQLPTAAKGFTYGVEHARIMAHRQDNWSGYRNEFIPYIENRASRAEQYRAIAQRRNNAGQVINDDYKVSDFNMIRRC